MSDKPKVYQGVRVKTTVKELLQRRRALQAAIKTARKLQQGVPNHNVDDALVTTHNLDLFAGRPDNCVQPCLLSENICNIPVENTFDSQHLMNVLPPENFTSCNNITNNVACPTATAQHWSNGYLPSSMDYYSNSLASSSPTDPYNLPSPVDYNSYSPPQSHSSSSSCYNSPTRMDLSSGFAPENYHYQHCTLQHCFCLSHLSGLQDSMPTTDYAPYGTSDCLYSASGEDSYFRREAYSAEMCYF